MRPKIINFNLALVIVFSILPAHRHMAQVTPDSVMGNLIQFNDNGFWCWYQDERAIIDTDLNKLITGSDASGQGTGGSNRNGQIEGVIYDLETGQSERYTFMNTSCDDHNAPAFLIRPDGDYLTVYAEHYDMYNSRYRIFDGASWTGEQRFDWMTIPGGTDFTVAYSNLFYLSAEDRIYNFARSHRRSPNMIVSEDMGETWSYGGMLTIPDVSIGYVNGYFIYYGNGVDRIDFICTEHHPRDYNTSMYHGYIKGGKSYRSDGTLLDNDITDMDAPEPADFTLIFEANTELNGYVMSRLWNVDIQGYDNGIITAIIKARIDDFSVSNDPEHCFLYCRFDGANWTTSYLSLAGRKMYSSEQDYTGLAAIDPNDPYTIYISTPVDPRDDNELDNREIFKGTSADNGSTWTWTPITYNSTTDNFRPIIPAWDENNRALLWCRGEYYTAQSFDAAIVGTIERENEHIGQMTYTDATILNTTLSNGDPVMFTGPAVGQGADDDLWHLRTEYGNNDTLFTSAEIGGEDAPALRTEIQVPKAGLYHVWVNFWANPSADWRIKAGLSESDMHLFRQMASRHVPEGEHTTTLIRSESDVHLYQAYLGKTEVPGSSFFVFIDDESIETGSTGNRIGNTARTWYDGISFATADYVIIDEPFIILNNTASATDSFHVSSNTDWTISGVETWLTLDTLATEGDQVLQVTATENTADTLRFSSIVISADNLPDSYIEIIQLPSSPSLSVSETEMMLLPWESNDSSFSITSNTVWLVTSSEAWLSADAEYSLGDQTVTLHATANQGFNDRTAEITVMSPNMAPQTITVTQLASSLLRVYPEEITLGADDNLSAELVIYSNVDWTVSETSDWLETSVSSGSDSSTITITALENQTEFERNAVVTFSSSSTVDFTVDVIQEEGDIEGITMNRSEYIEVYPLPAEDFIIVKNHSSSEAFVELITLEGRRLQTINTTENTVRIDLTDYSSGIYILKIKINEELHIQKIVKK